MNLLTDIALGLWRLLPGNPILTRVVAQGSKRVQHLWTRAAYLGILFFILFMQGGIGDWGGSLAESAKKATQVFLVVSIAQLGLMSFIAPVFCAGAITQEKDSNTYNILLTTPLSSAQIVLGSLFSRIYFVWVLLLSGLPLFCITMIFGGVTAAEVFQSFGLAATTGLVTGSVAIMVSFLKVGTRRTIFYFFAGVAVYLIAVGALGLTSGMQVAEAPLGEAALGMGRQYRLSWLAPFHPFLALMVVTGQTPPPSLAEVGHYGWPTRWALAYPQYAYMFNMTFASAVMILVSIAFVRRGEHEGEPTLIGRLTTRRIRSEADGEQTRRVRKVWNNPIAWREAQTRGAATGGPWVRWAIFAVGIIIGFTLLIAYHANAWPALNATTVRWWLTALIWIELAVILLMVSTTAASSLTRERESQTMEILLTTPLTSQYIVAGMLQGLVRYVVPLIGVPTLTLLVFWIVDLLRGRPSAAIPEAILLVPLLMISFASTAAMIGLQFSLHQKTTVRAIMLSATAVLGLSGLMWFCGQALLSAGEFISSAILPFLPFPAMLALVNPAELVPPDPSTLGAGTGGVAAPLEPQARFLRILFSLIATAVYLAITYALYQNMVRGFDMTIRRQST
jgi:ABC-type transport system involved in multi-copper enzyme maturation permease subunit